MMAGGKGGDEAGGLAEGDGTAEDVRYKIRIGSNEQIYLRLSGPEQPAP